MVDRRLCVFCGSSDGNEPAHVRLAVELGTALAALDVGLVYGGASIGLMGRVADAVLVGEGEVTGVIPQSLAEREIAHPGLTRLEVVSDMHERKRTMYDLSDGFIALPGGMGTYEEVFEAATWSKLGLHRDARRKQVVLLAGDGFWASLSSFLDSSVELGFMSDTDRSLVSAASGVDAAISAALS